MERDNYLKALALSATEEFEEMLFRSTADDNELKLYLEELMDGFKESSTNVPMNKAHEFMTKFISKTLWPAIELDPIEKILWLESVKESLDQEIDNYLSDRGEIYRNTLGYLRFTAY